MIQLKSMTEYPKSKVNGGRSTLYVQTKIENHVVRKDKFKCLSFIIKGNRKSKRISP